MRASARRRDSDADEYPESASAPQARRARKRVPPPPPPVAEDSEEVMGLELGGAFEDSARSLLARRPAGRPRKTPLPPKLPPPPSPAPAAAGSDPTAAGGGGATAAYGDFEAADIKEGGLRRTRFFESYFAAPEMTWRDLPLGAVPRDEDEALKMDTTLKVIRYQERMWQHEAFDELAFFESDKMLAKSHNIYANVHQVAGIMRQLEQEDFALGEQQTRFGSWSRAEILFSEQFDAFNAEVKRNIDSLVRQPLDEELRERLEAIGEATLLPPTEAEQLEPRFLAPDELAVFMDRNYLEGILPGVSLANANERYAEDIYSGDEAPDEIFNLADGDVDEGDGEE